MSSKSRRILRQAVSAVLVFIPLPVASQAIPDHFLKTRSKIIFSTISVIIFTKICIPVYYKDFIAQNVYPAKNYARRASFSRSKLLSRLTLTGRRRQATFAGVFVFDDIYNWQICQFEKQSLFLLSIIIFQWGHHLKNDIKNYG